jgi:glycine oxidase
LREQPLKESAISMGSATSRHPGSSPRILIAGAGVIGLTLALTFGRRGARVLVSEATRVGGGASAAAAGMLTPFYETDPHSDAHPYLAALAAESLRRWPAFAASLSADVGFRQRGVVYVARSADDSARLERAIAASQAPVSLLDGAGVRALEPAVSGDIDRAAFAHTEGQVDVRLLLPVLADACRQAGVLFDEGSEVLAVHQIGGRARGLMRADGRVTGGDCVVIAAGAWARRRFSDLAGLAHVAPVKGQICAVDAPGVQLDRPIEGPGVYLTPRGDEILVGATREPGDWSLTVDPSAIDGLLAAARLLAPGLAGARVTAQWAGLRPGLPDRAPVLGQSNLKGAFVACGHGRNGVLLAPVTADILADQILGGPPDSLALRFAPTRFAPAAQPAVRAAAAPGDAFNTASAGPGSMS